MSEKSKSFNKLLLESIDKALLSLGNSARQAIYSHFENTYKISRIDIPRNLEQFQLILEKIFGVGSRYLEILIMKNLYTEIKFSARIEQNQQLEFLEYIDAVRRNFVNPLVSEKHNRVSCF